MEPRPTGENFINNLTELGNFCGIDQAEVQRKKNSYTYKFTEILANLWKGLLGSNSISKAQNMIIKTAKLQANMNSIFQSFQEKYPELKEVIDQEKKEFEVLVTELEVEFSTEKKLLEFEKKEKDESPDAIHKHEEKVEKMADRFLEFEKNLRTTKLKTESAIASKLREKLVKKFDDIGGLNYEIINSIQATISLESLNEVAKLLNKIKTYSEQLVDGIKAQKQTLEKYGISPSVQKEIEDKQLVSFMNERLKVKDKNDTSVLDTQYRDLLFDSDTQVLDKAYPYVVKEHQAEVDQTLNQLENEQLRNAVKDSADRLFKEADQKPESLDKIRHLQMWLELQLVNGIQGFLQQEIDKLDTLLDSFHDKLSDLQLDPAKWKSDVKKALNQKINGVKDAESANALAKEITELKDFEKLNLLLDPMERRDVHVRQMNFEVRALEKKFPKRRTDQLLGFLGELGKDTRLEQISQKLVLASKSTSIEDKEKLISEINSIKEEEIVGELKVKIREKSQKINEQKDKDIEQMRTRHESLISNYPWLAEDGHAILEEYTTTFNSLIPPPTIEDLDDQKELLKMMTYTENRLISTESNVQRNYAAKKKEAENNYSIRLQQQIANQLKNTLLPLYQEVTKESQNNEENLTVFNNFIEDKAEEIKSQIRHSTTGIEKYKNLKANKELENELRDNFKSIWDTLNNLFG